MKILEALKRNELAVDELNKEPAALPPPVILLFQSLPAVRFLAAIWMPPGTAFSVQYPADHESRQLPASKFENYRNIWVLVRDS